MNYSVSFHYEHCSIKVTFFDAAYDIDDTDVIAIAKGSVEFDLGFVPTGWHDYTIYAWSEEF